LANHTTIALPTRDQFIARVGEHEARERHDWLIVFAVFGAAVLTIALQAALSSRSANVGSGMSLLLINRTRLPDADFGALQLAVAEHATLERVLGWGRTQVPPRRVEEIITQDEFTHDVLVPLDNSQYLAYDVT